MRLIQRLWSETGVTHEGRYFQVRNFTLLPRPAQTPCPDVWFGGNSRPALRRTAEIGTGGLPSFRTPEEYRADAEQIRTLAAIAGRMIDPEHFGVLIAYVTPRDRDRAQEFLSRLAAFKRGEDLETLLVFGDDAALRERIEAFIAAGASKFVIVPLVAPPNWTDELGRLRDNVARPVEGTR